VDDVAALAGSVAAATRGTDPYFVLVQALREFDVPRERVEILNLQHADGRTALFGGSVQAWSGLDPIMADAQRDGDASRYGVRSFAGRASTARV
jgi:sulfonate transport system substrate-binding protein